jgi:plastocyanin
MWFMMIWMVLFWGGVIAGVFWLLGAIGRRSRSNAADILDERLARGEIDAAEHSQLRDQLRRGGPGRPGRTVLIAGAVAAALLILFAVPMAIMAAGGWDMGMDMWDMHGGGRNTSNSPLVRQGQSADVSIDDFTFTPGSLEVERGATVTWTNRDSAPHDATARNGDWETDTLSRGDTDSVTFDDSGDYDYYCSIHPSMKARLVVR